MVVATDFIASLVRSAPGTLGAILPKEASVPVCQETPSQKRGRAPFSPVAEAPSLTVAALAHGPAVPSDCTE